MDHRYTICDTFALLPVWQSLLWNVITLLCCAMLENPSTLLSGGNIDAFLERIVALVSSHIRTDVVSVYLYDSTAQELVLRATRGLAPACVGNIRLRLGEGLVGHVLQTLEPICEQAASQNPHFKYFPKTYEERFESFLAVPVHRSAERMGVLVAQRRERDFFGSRDVLALQVLASQLAGAIENARTVHTALARKAAPETSIPTLVRGRTVSKGYAYARAVLLNTVRSRRSLAPQRFDTHYYTLAEFQSAIRATEEDLLALEQRFAAGLPELAALVFMAHQMMLIEEQVIIYARLVQDLPERPIAIRTLDIGGDKGFGRQAAEPEENPQLSLRSIRFSLHFPEIFQQQLRAILRGGAAARDLRILFPMIGSLEEWRVAQAAVRSALVSLAQDGLPHCSNPALGIMIEVPSAVQLMEEFAAEEIDFFCIGTNDLVQYLLGVDRGNEKVAAYYRPDHPAVFRSIHQVVSVAERYGRPVSLCGKMAHDLRFIPFFLGIGIRALSVDPRYLPALQPAVEAIDSREATTLASHLLGCPTGRELETLLAHPGS